MDSLILFGAQYLIALPVLAALYVLWGTNDKKRYLYVTIGALVVAYILAKLAGLVYYDPLPFVEGGFEPLFPHVADNGFPSDHTLIASVLALSVWYFKRSWGLLLLVVAFLIGASRVAAGVHHVQDVVASILIALVVTYVIQLFVPKAPTS